jgi:predicted dehydrogenase/nucleoside-diphosphate-sugar epimerase
MSSLTKLDKRKNVKTQSMPVKLCIIGCGIQTEQAYLPTLSHMGECQIECLMDIDLARCSTLAERYHIPHYTQRIDDIPASVDAAIVVLPHNLHSPVSCDLMQKNMHVFCEKPMATTRAEAEAMLRCAQEHAVHLGIGNIYRFYWTSQRVKEIVASRELGDLVSFHIEEGKMFYWPTPSGFYFDKEKAGGGVLIDTGSHILDLLLWWLQDYPTEIEYQDDNFGGIEAECSLQLGFSTSVHGSVKFSRLTKLKNKYTLSFTKGTLSFQPYDPSGVCHTITIQRDDKVTQLKAKHTKTYFDYFKDQMETFLSSIKNNESSMISGESVLPSIQLIEACYKKDKRLHVPWFYQKKTDTFLASKSHDRIDLGNSKILITGASGFIGGRLAERLYFNYGNTPRCLLRNFHNVSRLMRIPGEIVIGDVLDFDSLVKASAGCDAVIHTAYGNTPDDDVNVKINTIGTENVIRAALHNGVKRLIHLSTVEVYGRNQPSFVNEETATGYSHNQYGNSKLDAEHLCWKYYHEHALPVIILRLSVVYGPHAPIWTVNVINRLLNRGFCLSDEFTGICNAIYIDDCIDAIFLAITRHDVLGETFIVSGGEKLTWNEYFSKYNEVLNMPPLTSASKERLQFYRSIRKMFDLIYNNLQSKYGNDIFVAYSKFRERDQIPNIKAFLQKGSLLEALDIFNRQAYYSIKKAHDKLGFEPRYNFKDGMRMVEAWLMHTSQIQ